MTSNNNQSENLSLRDNEFDANDLLRDLTTQDFLSFGLHDIAYIKAVEVAGQKAFAVHAADGTPISVVESFDLAEMSIMQSELETVPVH